MAKAGCQVLCDLLDIEQATVTTAMSVTVTVTQKGCLAAATLIYSASVSSDSNGNASLDRRYAIRKEFELQELHE
jgi:hypothetical protein